MTSRGRTDLSTASLALPLCFPTIPRLAGSAAATPGGVGLAGPPNLPLC